MSTQVAPGADTALVQAVLREVGKRVVGQEYMVERLLISMLTGGHDATNLPVVVLGGAGGQIQGGRVLDYLGQPNRKMCSLYLSMLDKCGIRLKEFGDSNERLAEV